MNAVQFHLVVTHVPVVGTLFALLLLIMGWLRHSDELKRASLVCFIIVGLVAIPTFLSGSPSAAVLKKNAPGYSLKSQDQHEEVAQIALTSTLVTALAALAGIIVFRQSRTLPRWFLNLAFLLAVVSFATMLWTSSLGGKVRHTEIQTDTVTAGGGY